jgi:hypothetical protein
VSKRVFRLALLVLLFALSFSVEAQQPTKVPRIGFVTGGSAATGPQVEAFRRGTSRSGLY